MEEKEKTVLYYTVAGEGKAESIVEKSRFIGHVTRAETREEAEIFFSDIREKYRDASHNVPVFVILEKMNQNQQLQQLQWASDDKEPAGTAGLPILQLLAGRNISNIAVMVTRYFGGIKLGTGGLSRAYSAAAAAALENAGISEVCNGCRMYFKASYKDFERIRSASEKIGHKPENVIYTEDVSFQFHIDANETDMLKKLIKNASNGSAKLIKSDKEMLLIDIP